MVSTPRVAREEGPLYIRRPARKRHPKQAVGAPEGGEATPMFWEEHITTQFAGEEALLQLLPYFCKIEADDRRGSKYDPITSAVITFLSTPLHLCLTGVGAMLFHGRATLIYPYNLMSEGQKQFVRTCLDQRKEWNIYNDTVVFRRSKAPVNLCPSAVLTTLCRKMFDSQTHTEPARRIALCNIILQRVQGYVRIDKDVQRQLNDWLAQRQAGA